LGWIAVLSLRRHGLEGGATAGLEIQAPGGELAAVDYGSLADYS
jgi:hypothetical protein